MSVSPFNDQKLMAGQRIGISTAYAVCIYFVILALMPMNTYHLSNLFTNLLSGGAIWTGFLYVLAFALTAAEVPIVQSLVTNYRLDPDSKIVKVLAFVLVVLMALTIAGGNISQFIAADKKDAAVQSHGSQESSYQDRKKSLDSDWRVATRAANKIKDSSDRSIAISQANSNYYSSVADLKVDLSGHQATRPTSGVKNGSFLHILQVNLVSFACTLVAAFLSGFLAVYYSTLVASPAFSFMSKKAHEWLSDASNFVSASHEVSPISDKTTGHVKVDKSASVSTPPGHENDHQESAENRPTHNRPEPVTTGMGAVSDTTGEGGIRTPDQEGSEGGKFRAINVGDIEEAKRAVIAGDLSPTIKPVKLWLLETRQVGISDIERQNTAKKLLDGMFKEGILILNPDQKNTKQMLAKYVLASSVKSEQAVEPETEDPDQIGEFDITTRCGHCGDYAYTRIDELLDNQNGVVKCLECDKGYMAQSHLTSDSNPITNELKERAIDARKAGGKS